METRRHASDSTCPIDVNGKIVDYWSRRGALSEAEWVDFYRCTVPLLMRTRLPEEYADQGKRRDLVDCFFQDKILLNAASSGAGPLHNAHALHQYLKNYATDISRRERCHESLESLAQEEPAQGDAKGRALDRARHAALLGEAGIDADAAMHKASRFLSTLEPGERDYLRDHACADDGAAEPISSIARRHALGSTYHTKARKLGVTRSKGETYAQYGQTKIGQWLLSAGARLDPDWREEIAVLLVLLCHQAGLHPREAA